MSVAKQMLEAEVVVRFRGRMAEGLRREAIARGVRSDELALHVLRAVIQDGLWGAVLDGPPRPKARAAEAQQP